MLAGMRSRFLLSCLWMFALAACRPVQAQMNGVPPSVTSIGFGGRFMNGVRPSVTSLGPNGYGYGYDWSVFENCCSNFLLPASPSPSLSSGRHHRRKDKDGNRNNDHADFAVGVVEPVYVPYPVPYAQGTDDDPPVVDSLRDPGPPNQDDSTGRTRYRAPDPEEPVTAQPPTVLVFKDGHQSDVLNYAIVGDTLFDLAAGRTRKIPLADVDLPATHKANDHRGVDVQIPASKTRR